MLRREPCFFMPYIDGLQYVAIYIEHGLSGRVTTITRANEKAQCQFLIAQVEWDGHMRAKPGGDVIAAPEAANHKICPSRIIKIGLFCPREIAFTEAEDADVMCL